MNESGQEPNPDTQAGAGETQSLGTIEAPKESLTAEQLREQLTAANREAAATRKLHHHRPDRGY